MKMNDLFHLIMNMKLTLLLLSLYFVIISKVAFLKSTHGIIFTDSWTISKKSSKWNWLLKNVLLRLAFDEHLSHFMVLVYWKTELHHHNIFQMGDQSEMCKLQPSLLMIFSNWWVFKSSDFQNFLKMLSANYNSKKNC